MQIRFSVPAGRRRGGRFCPVTLEPGEDVKLEGVLLIVDGEEITVGTPTVKGATVKTKVVEHFKGEKTINFQYRPKKRIRQKTGHRQPYTRLAVDKIVTK